MENSQMLIDGWTVVDEIELRKVKEKAETKAEELLFNNEGLLSFLVELAVMDE